MFDEALASSLRPFLTSSKKALFLAIFSALVRSYSESAALLVALLTVDLPMPDSSSDVRSASESTNAFDVTFNFDSRFRVFGFNSAGVEERP
jgi:hypothetical protein